MRIEPLLNDAKQAHQSSCFGKIDLVNLSLEYSLILATKIPHKTLLIKDEIGLITGENYSAKMSFKVGHIIDCERDYEQNRKIIPLFKHATVLISKPSSSKSNIQKQLCLADQIKSDKNLLLGPSIESISANLNSMNIANKVTAYNTNHSHQNISKQISKRSASQGGFIVSGVQSSSDILKIRPKKIGTRIKASLNPSNTRGECKCPTKLSHSIIFPRMEMQSLELEPGTGAKKSRITMITSTSSNMLIY
jgi:hypothetical protein